MAKITLSELRHSYKRSPRQDADYALQRVHLDWTDGGAYALLGPSGCGKTTLLNIISGLLKATEGQILFDGRDVSSLSPDQRNIAQVFQFPVVYDTMTVFDSLAFPLRNRGMTEVEVKRRVEEIADMTDLTATLKKRASGLTADGKQKISLGRGLVRADVNAILFDEPLTVIDPYLKWRLRSKLKELHQRIGTTMIYVTHDQTEALTFADKVVVMLDGAVVQAGTPVELFERPSHTFVGHFIGSPGMNVLPCVYSGGCAVINGIELPVENRAAVNRLPAGTGGFELGVRPEFVRFADTGLPVSIEKVSDTGRFRIVETSCGDQKIRLLLSEDDNIPADNARVSFDPAFTRIYARGGLVE